MKYPQITREHLLHELQMSLCFRQIPVAVSLDSLKMAFGFERKSGEEIMFKQFLMPSKTEEIQQSLPLMKMLQNIEEWGRKNGYAGELDSAGYTYIFNRIIPKSF